MNQTAENIHWKADHLSLVIMSKVLCICEQRNISRKELAVKLNTSQSYLTQLFRGDKRVNMMFMAKIQSVLNINFIIDTKERTLNQ